MNPEEFSIDDGASVIGHVFDAPLVTHGWTWVPLTQLVTWWIMCRVAARQHPEFSWKKRCQLGGLTMSIILGSEWGHNLAHAVVASRIGKPVDAIRINLGMPLLIYDDAEETAVHPQEHIWRAMGGPVFNLILLVGATYLQRFFEMGTPARDAVNAARDANLALLVAGMTPQPWLDGGSMLKWIVVARGKTLSDADKIVRRANGAATVGLGCAAVAALKRRRRFLGGFFGFLAALCLAAASGRLKEQV